MNSMQSRSLRLLLAAFLIGSLVACNDDSSKSDPALAKRTADLADSEESLLQKRDALLNSRRRLRAKREELAAERKRILASGGDASEVEKKQEELKQEEAQLGESEDQFNEELSKLLSEQRNVLASIANKGDDKGRIAAREGSVASRENDLAKREARVADRERLIAEREAALAKREKETCGVQTITTVAAAPTPPAGTTYRKKDVDPLLSRARRHMSKKGILKSDLPAPAQGLEKEATKAMKKGDYASAHFAARQLMATVDSTRIDRAFIQAKIGRLSARMKGGKLSDKTQKKVDKLFKEATKYYGDGKYTKSNKRLNQIYSAI